MLANLRLGGALGYQDGDQLDPPEKGQNVRRVFAQKLLQRGNFILGIYYFQGFIQVLHLRFFHPGLGPVDFLLVGAFPASEIPLAQSASVTEHGLGFSFAPRRMGNEGDLQGVLAYRDAQTFVLVAAASTLASSRAGTPADNKVAFGPLAFSTTSTSSKVKSAPGDSTVTVHRPA